MRALRTNWLSLLLSVPRDGAAAPPAISEDQVRRLIEREGQGDTKRAIRVLMKENHAAREDRRKLTEEKEALQKAGRIAPEGGAVLTADDAKVWAKVSKHLADSKVTVDQLIENGKKAGELETKLSAMERKELHTKVAESLGWNGAALTDVLELKKLDVTFRDVTTKEDGKTVVTKVAHVRPAGDEKAPWEALDENYVDANLKTFRPALEASADEDEGDDTSAAAEPTQERRRTTTSGTPMPHQTKAKPPKTGGKTEKELRDEAIGSGMYGGI